MSGMPMPPELAALVQQLPPDLQQRFLALPPDQQMQLVQEFLSQQSGGPPPGVLAGPAGGPLPPSGPPPPMPMPPDMVGAMPPGMPMPAGPHQMPDGSMMGQPPPPPPPPPPQPRKPKPKPPEKLPLPPLEKNIYGAGPDRALVLEHAELGWNRYRARNEAISAAIRLYHREREWVDLTGETIDPAGGAIEFTSVLPSLFVERMIGLAAAVHERLTLKVEPASIEVKSREAAQACENALRTWREVDESRWFRRGTDGDAQIPLPYKEMGLAAIEGGCGMYIWIDPAEKRYPHYYEPVPISQLYPIGPAITRQFWLTVGEARRRYPEVATAYPRGSKDQRDTESPSPTDLIKIICWADTGGLWHVITWAEGPSWRREGSDEKEYWIKPPSEGRIDFGFCPYQYHIAGGSPVAQFVPQNSGTSSELIEEHRSYGVLNQTGDTYRTLNKIGSLVLEGAAKAIRPATVEYLHPESEKPLPLATYAGANNVRTVGERVDPIVPSFAGSADGQATMGLVQSGIQDAAPPVLAGRGAASSGFDRFQASEQAGALFVDKLVQFAEEYYSSYYKLRLELTRRKGTGKGSWNLSKLPVRVFKGAAIGTLGLLSAEDVAYNSYDRDSPGVRVRFQRMSEIELMQKSERVLRQIDAKVLSRLRGMDMLGIEDPEEEQQQIFAESAVLLDPAMHKAAAGQALLEQNDPFLLAQWEKARAAEDAPPPAGRPSPPGATAMPGTPAGGLPSEMTARAGMPIGG